jgi:hypothetical protein
VVAARNERKSEPGSAASPEEVSEAECVAKLSSADPAQRFAAARTLYDSGRERALSTIKRWKSEPDFSCYLSRVQKSPSVTILQSLAPAKPYPANATVGIAVTPANFERIRAAAGSPPLSNVPPDQDAKEFELNLAGRGQDSDQMVVPVRLDILTTKNSAGDGAIAKFLAKFGEGIQQVEIDVTNVDRATQVLAEKFGQEAIYPATRPGADGTRVNFFLASTEDGKKILIELVEHKITGHQA